MPISHLVFSNLKTWPLSASTTASARSNGKPTSTSSRLGFNRRFYPFTAFLPAAQYRGGCRRDLRRPIFRRLDPPHM